MATVSTTFSDAGSSSQLFVRKGEDYTYSIDYSADFDGGLFIERSEDGGISWHQMAEFAVGYKTDVAEVLVCNAPGGIYRFRCILDPEADPAVLTGTAAVTLENVADEIIKALDSEGATVFEIKEDGAATFKRPGQTKIFPISGLAKAGATAGWVVAGASDTCLATLPAGSTASTMVMPIALPLGCTITGFYLTGQIESGGNTATLDADLRKHTAAAADVADASVGTITQLSVTADAIVSSANAGVTGLSEVVAADETFYVLITGTTGVATDIALQGLAVVIDEV